MSKKKVQPTSSGKIDLNGTCFLEKAVKHPAKQDLEDFDFEDHLLSHLIKTLSLLKPCYIFL